MAKVTLPRFTNSFSITSKLNQLVEQLENLFQNSLLFRNNPEGEPNHLFNPLDLNGKRIINLNDGASPTDAVNVRQLEVALGTGDSHGSALAGGSEGQVLTKASNSDYDIVWRDAEGGGGVPVVESVEDLHDIPVDGSVPLVYLKGFHATHPGVGAGLVSLKDGAYPQAPWNPEGRWFLSNLSPDMHWERVNPAKTPEEFGHIPGSLRAHREINACTNNYGECNLIEGRNYTCSGRVIAHNLIGNGRSRPTLTFREDDALDPVFELVYLGNYPNGSGSGPLFPAYRGGLIRNVNIECGSVLNPSPVTALHVDRADGFRLEGVRIAGSSGYAVTLEGDSSSALEAEVCSGSIKGLVIRNCVGGIDIIDTHIVEAEGVDIQLDLDEVNFPVPHERFVRLSFTEIEEVSTWDPFAPSRKFSFRSSVFKRLGSFSDTLTPGLVGTDAGGAAQSVSFTQCVFEDTSFPEAVGGRAFFEFDGYGGAGLIDVTSCVFAGNECALVSRNTTFEYDAGPIVFTDCTVNGRYERRAAIVTSGTPGDLIFNNLKAKIQSSVYDAVLVDVLFSTLEDPVKITFNGGDIKVEGSSPKIIPTGKPIMRFITFNGTLLNPRYDSPRALRYKISGSKEVVLAVGVGQVLVDLPEYYTTRGHMEVSALIYSDAGGMVNVTDLASKTTGIAYSVFPNQVAFILPSEAVGARVAYIIKEYHPDGFGE